MNDFGSAGHAGDYTVAAARGDGEALCGEPRRCLTRTSTSSSINTIRTLDGRRRPGCAARAIRARRSALAPAAYVLYTRIMKHNPADPQLARPRPASSSRPATPRCCSTRRLHLSGYDVTLDDIKQFRQLGSHTPGHPEYGDTPGVETTTGPLGQGFGNGVGMAMAEKFLRENGGSLVVSA